MLTWALVDHALVHGRVLVDQLLELCGRAADGAEAQLRQLGLDLGRLHGFGDRLGQLVHDRLGRALGRQPPTQEFITKPGKPASSMVGMSGSPGQRCFDATASTLILPLLAWGMGTRAGSNSMSTWPAHQVSQDGRAAVVGHVLGIQPVSCAQRAPIMWALAPVPLEA